MVSFSKSSARLPFCFGVGLLSEGGRTSQALSAVVFSGRPFRFAGDQRTRPVLRPVAGHGWCSKRRSVCLWRQ